MNTCLESFLASRKDGPGVRLQSNPASGSRRFRYPISRGEPSVDGLWPIRLLETKPIKRADGARTILSIGDDGDLLRTRHLVLESAGYQVYSIAGSGMIEDSGILRVDLALICHSIQEIQAVQIVSSLRKVNSLLPILRLTTSFSGYRRSCNDALASLDGPKSLLDKIQCMLANAGSRV
jgi:hypothetical protein